MNSTPSSIRRWAPWLALVVVFSVATTLLSWWQFDRRQERVERISVVLENFDSPALPLDELLGADGFNLSKEWRQAELAGRYLPELTLVVRNRPLSGQAGFLQVVPFQLEDGRTLMVERGWLRAGNPITAPATNPIPDANPRTIIVRLRAAEQKLDRAAVAGQLPSLNFEDVTRELPNLTTAFYGRLALEVPASGELPMPMPKPSLDEGNHLSYALQWLLFGLMAFAALIWAYRQDRRIRLGLPAKGNKKKSQAQLDAEIEDAG
jgi:cytochrome oxidase assembly protein ShyY1